MVISTSKKFNLYNFFVINRSKISFSLLFLFMLALGMLITFLRNPDPLIHQILYAEDGVWTGGGLTQGWIYTIFNARPDYFVLLNVACLFLATKISFLVSGNPLNFLPESIALIAYAVFAFIPTVGFFITKRIMPVVSAFFLYVWMLLIPLHDSQNEILGRLSQVGFYVPILVVFILYYRSYSKSLFGKIIADLGLFICAATNPATYALCLFYLIWDFTQDYDLWAYIKRNITLLFFLGSLLAFLLIRMFHNEFFYMMHGKLAPQGILRSCFHKKTLIETLTARSLLYPFVYYFYHHLSNTTSILLTLLWFIFIFASYKVSTTLAIKRLILFSFTAIIIMLFLTILMRPGLTCCLSHYNSTYPDRYFMEKNILVIFVTSIAMGEWILRKKSIGKTLLYIIVAIFFILYISHLSKVFRYPPVYKVQTGLSFREQICIAKKSGSKYIIPTYPDKWFMEVPGQYIDKSKCIYISSSEPGLAGLKKVSSYVMTPSKPLNLNSKIFLKLPSLDGGKTLEKIGIMFGTYGGKARGEAQLNLKTSENKMISQVFSQKKLSDKEYHYFKVISEKYISGSITAVSGGGVSVWKVKNKMKNLTHTCIVFVYRDGFRRFTPGCPIPS